MDATAVVDAYVAAWNERDDERRAALLAESFSQEGTYRDPLFAVSGRSALVDHIAGFQERFAGTSMTRRSGVDGYQDVCRFAWAVVNEDESVALHGVDIVSLDEVGKIRSVTGFFGPLE